MIVQKLGQLPKAERLYQLTFSIRKRVLGEGHIDTLKTACNLGLVLNVTGQHKEAEPVLRDAVLRLEKIVGREHFLTLTTLMNLALVINKNSPGSNEAIELGLEATEGRRRILGEEHPDTLEGLRDWFTLLHGEGRDKEAEDVGRRALQ